MTLERITDNISTQIQSKVREPKFKIPDNDAKTRSKHHYRLDKVIKVAQFLTASRSKKKRNPLNQPRPIKRMDKDDPGPRSQIDLGDRSQIVLKP